MDMLANRISPREIFACENVVNVNYYRRVLVVLWCDETAAQEGYSHRLLKAAFNEIKHHLGHLLEFGGLWLTLDPEGQRGIMDHRARGERDGNCLDAGNGAQGIVKVAKSGACFGGGGCAGGRHGQREGDGVAGIEAGIDAPKRREGTRHQARADQQYQGHGNFAGDKNSLEPVASVAASAALLEYLLQIHARSLQRGSKAKNNSSKQ